MSSVFEMGRLAVPVTERDHARGPPEATVELVEYGDFECPYCGAAYGVLKRIEAELGDDLLVAFRHFPLTRVHPHAFAAACAAEAAGMQDRFWEMHDTLFENQDALALPDLLRYAAALDLDLARFERDVGSPQAQARIREDVRSGVRSGVNGTPTFFLNGLRHDGGWDDEDLRQAILEALG